MLRILIVSIVVALISMPLAILASIAGVPAGVSFVWGITSMCVGAITFIVGLGIVVWISDRDAA